VSRAAIDLSRRNYLRFRKGKAKKEQASEIRGLMSSAPMEEDEAVIVLATDSDGKSLVYANGAVYVDIPGVGPAELGTLGFGLVYLGAAAVAGAYSSAISGCSASAVNAALGSLALNGILGDMDGVSADATFLMNCISRGMNAGGAGGTPEY
jgi:hypothetical protein